MIEKGIPKHMGIVVLVGVISVLSPSFQFQPVRRLIFHLYVCAGCYSGTRVEGTKETTTESSAIKTPIAAVPRNTPVHDRHASDSRPCILNTVSDKIETFV